MAAPCRMPHHGACRSALHLLVPAAGGPCVMSWLALIPEASAHAHNIDLLIGGFSLLILFLAGPVFILIFAFAIRYRRGKQVNRDHPPNRNVWLETYWSIIPFLLIRGFFIISVKIFLDRKSQRLN